MITDDDRPHKFQSPSATANIIGCDLSALSVSDLEDRVQALQAEIVRTQAEIDKKKAQVAAASAFFK
jgi:uncharacterized small protein (DUF1192 family)